MKGALQIAKLSGIPVRVHWSFGLLIFYILYLGQSGGMGWQGTFWVALLFIALFACVVLHEFGHALSARYYGVKTHDIILSPIGGIARLDRLPEKPVHEFVVAIAGPVVNVLIALLLSPYLYFFTEFFTNLFSGAELLEGNQHTAFGQPANFLPLLFSLNILLALFNLLPAFPMDGGRIFRALLAIKFKRSTATRIASYLGQAIAVLFFLYGVSESDYIIAFIGIFVFFTASSEYRMVKLDERLSNYAVGDLMRTQFTRLRPGNGIAIAIHELKHGLEKSFLVVDEWQEAVGFIHEGLIQQARQKGDFEATVEDYMKRDLTKLTTSESLKSAFQKMQKQGSPIMPVYENLQLVGVIDARVMNDFLWER